MNKGGRVEQNLPTCKRLGYLSKKSAIQSWGGGLASKIRGGGKKGNAIIKEEGREEWGELSAEVGNKRLLKISAYARAKRPDSWNKSAADDEE